MKKVINTSFEAIKTNALSISKNQQQTLKGGTGSTTDSDTGIVTEDLIDL